MHVNRVGRDLDRQPRLIRFGSSKELPYLFLRDCF